MEWLVNNWVLPVCAVCAVVSIIVTILQFSQKPTEEQVRAIKEWLLYAVTMAEKELGSGTGKLKLRQVYDMFLQRFPWAAKVVSFDQFKWWAEEALAEMKQLLASEGSAVRTFLEDKG